MSLYMYCTAAVVYLYYHYSLYKCYYQWVHIISYKIYNIIRLFCFIYILFGDWQTKNNIDRVQD